jgi:hypothetical protein
MDQAGRWRVPSCLPPRMPGIRAGVVRPPPPTTTPLRCLAPPQVVAAVASMPKSSSPLLEGLVAEGIITADEAASCSPEQLEFLIRKRFRPESSPERVRPSACTRCGLLRRAASHRCRVPAHGGARWLVGQRGLPQLLGPFRCPALPCDAPLPCPCPPSRPASRRTSLMA